MNTYTGVIAGLLFAVGAALIASNTQDDLPVIDSNHAEAMASLQKSQEHLDSMLAMAEQMHRDLIVMNQNSDFAVLPGASVMRRARL